MSAFEHLNMKENRDHVCFGAPHDEGESPYLSHFQCAFPAFPVLFSMRVKRAYQVTFTFNMIRYIL